jgi:hypothetical protein
VSEERERKHRFKQERQREIYNSRTPISEDDLKILTPEQQREYEEIAAKVSYSSEGPYTTRQFQKKTIVSEERTRQKRLFDEETIRNSLMLQERIKTSEFNFLNREQKEKFKKINDNLYIKKNEVELQQERILKQREQDMRLQQEILSSIPHITVEIYNILNQENKMKYMQDRENGGYKHR